MPEFWADGSVGSRKQQKSIPPDNLNYLWLFFFFLMHLTNHRSWTLYAGSLNFPVQHSSIPTAVCVFPLELSKLLSQKFSFFPMLSKSTSICLLKKVFIYQFPSLVSFETKKIELNIIHSFIFTTRKVPPQILFHNSNTIK